LEGYPGVSESSVGGLEVGGVRKKKKKLINLGATGWGILAKERRSSPGSIQGKGGGL